MSGFDSAARSLVAVAAALYAAGWATRMRRYLVTGRALTFCGWAVTAALVALNAYAVKAPPFGNMYQVLVVLSLCFLPLFAVLGRRTDLGRMAPHLLLVAILPLAGAFFMQKDASWRRMPALQSPWFVPHVLAYMIGYALALLAAVLLAAKRVGRRGEGEAARRDRAAHETVRFAFPFLTFGMLSGALWAEEAWGQYWSWDPKETWSLVMWMGYAVYLHAWKRKDLRTYADLAHLLAFLALLVTFLLVNLLPRLGSLLHGYA